MQVVHYSSTMCKSHKSRTYDQMECYATTNLILRKKPLQRTQFWLALHEFWCRAFFWLLDYTTPTKQRIAVSIPVTPLAGGGGDNSSACLGPTSSLVLGMTAATMGQCVLLGMCRLYRWVCFLAASLDPELCLDGRPSKRVCCKEKWWAQQFFLANVNVLIFQFTLNHIENKLYRQLLCRDAVGHLL